MQIAHVALWTRDLDRAATFWADHFGASVGPLYQSARRPGFISRFLTLGSGPAVELMSGPWVRDRPLDGDTVETEGWAHIALSLGSRDAVVALAARMNEIGRLVAPPRTTGDGFFEAVVSDPDGNLIEITA